MQSRSLNKNSTSRLRKFCKSAQIRKIKEIKNTNGLSKIIISQDGNK